MQDLLAGLLQWDWRLLVLLAAAVTFVFAGRRAASGQTPNRKAERLRAAAGLAATRGRASKAYALLTRGVREVEAAQAAESIEAGEASALLDELRLRRAELLLAMGFAGPCASESGRVAGPEAAVLRARALAAQGNWAAAARLLKEPAVAAAASQRGLMREDVPLSALADLGERQLSGAMDFAHLMGGAVDAGHTRLPLSFGPLRFESSKLSRVDFAGRGKGIVATEDIQAGDLLIVARPIELLCPGDPAWRPSTDLEPILAGNVHQRVLHDAQAAEEVFSLFEGPGSPYSPCWQPQQWDPGAFAPPTPGGAGSRQLLERAHRVVKHNAHRWPGRDPTSGGPAPGLGLWLCPPMVNHAVEDDGRPNCAHVFIGDAMVFRATWPIKSGEELLDRYSTPLVDRFEWTLRVLKEHGMEDGTYREAAVRWGELDGAVAPFVGASSTRPLARSRALLVEALGRVERMLKWSAGNLLALSEADFRDLRECYRAAAAETRAEARAGGPEGAQGELLLAPPEVRCLNLLCSLALRWEGRGAALELRAELVRRVALARPFHFAAVKLWAELWSRLRELRSLGAQLSPAEQALESEISGEVLRCASFWLGREPQGRELQEVFVPWVQGAGGFHFGWFSSVPTERLLIAHGAGAEGSPRQPA